MSPNTFQSVVLCEGVTPDPFRLRVSNPVGTALLFQKPRWVNTHNASTQNKRKTWITNRKKLRKTPKAGFSEWRYKARSKPIQNAPKDDFNFDSSLTQVERPARRQLSAHQPNLTRCVAVSKNAPTNTPDISDLFDLFNF
jgi:hypothetical protein